MRGRRTPTIPEQAPRSRGRYLRWPSAVLGAFVRAGAVVVPPSTQSTDPMTLAAPRAAAVRCADWSNCTSQALPTTRVPSSAVPTATTATTTATTPRTSTSAPTTATTATAPLTHVPYAPSAEVIANPERGFTHYTETRWSPDGSAYTPLDGQKLTTWRTTEAVTLVYRVFYLGGLADRDVVDQAFLGAMAADLATARAAGVKLVVRFAYSPDDGGDAPPARATGHVRQLASVLNAASDVVLVLQAGFIGRWGGGDYSHSYASHPPRPWGLTRAAWAPPGPDPPPPLHAASSHISGPGPYP